MSGLPSDGVSGLPSRGASRFFSRGAVRVTAPWVRTRLRTAPGTACALALLVALTACLAAAFPRAVDRYEDAGLRRAAEQARPDRTGILVYAPPPSPMEPARMREDGLRPDALARRYAEIRAELPDPLVLDRAQSAYGVRTTVNIAVPDPWLPRPTGKPAEVNLIAQSGLAAHSSVARGRLPRAAGHVTSGTTEVEAAVSAETAKSLHIKVGSVIHAPAAGRTLAVRVTGIVTPRDPEGAYWSTKSLLRTPALIREPAPSVDMYWLGALLLAPEAAPVLLATPGNPERYWQLAPSEQALRARDTPALRSALASLEAGPALRKVRLKIDGEPTEMMVYEGQTDITTDLDEVLIAYDRLREGVAPLVAVAAFGTGAVAVVVLLMAGGLTADRRRTELALLRARGASLRGLTTRLFTETAVVAVPAGALGLAAALLTVPEGRAAYAVAAAVAVTAVTCAALPLRAAAAHRRVRVHTGREDVSSVRPSRRRTVAELTLLVLAAGAVETLRRRGTSGSSGQLVSLAPVLVGVIAALVLVRLYPLPLRGLARPAARLRGAVAHLSLARAGRTSASAVLPLLALLTALTTAAFGGSVLAGVREARDHAALLAVGADARVETVAPLPSDLPDRLRRTPGVSALSEVSVAYEAKPESGPQTVPLVGVDPADYSALARGTGLGAFPEARLRASGSSGDSGDSGDSGNPSDPGDSGSSSGSGKPVPALASEATARTYGTRPFPVLLPDGDTVTVRITAVRDRTPAVTGSDFLVVDREALPKSASRTTALLLTGSDLSGAALRKAAPKDASVHLRSEERARFVDSPLQSGAERVYTTAVAAGTGYAVLALLLSLLRAAPERTALLARLRTMGLTRSQSRRLLILESLPQAALAALGGVLTGWATILLLSPGIDLTAIALPSAGPSSSGTELRTDALSLAIPAVSVLLLAVGMGVGQAWWSGRRGSVRELRAGDAR
ncbi:FtsX-like permease family protein [Streptomyces sp. SID13726]|uniref:FtsX-like permease family protein n=1 Tax=Streptomyces sp. SID13726 TaxID=2706058 RepID=UPI0013B75A43|nr:FtsX-like permease family protein [Streptomyces sp. SID13726]NEB01841.1 ABC transporter permease [Streptomyces sp. SID13726]